MDEIKELFDIENKIDLALSYSRLSDFDRNGPKALKEKISLTGEGAKIGSIVDDLIFDNDNFDSKYTVFDTTKPTATLGSLADIILNNYNEIPNLNTVLSIVRKNNFWSRTIDEDKLISKFDIKDFWNYLELMFSAKEKTLITLDEKLLSQDIVDTLKIHDYSKNYFNNTFETIYQKEFKFRYKEFTLRGVIDIVLIDRKNKTIRLIDLKTGQSKASEFLSSFLKFRYYLQESVYMMATDHICKELGLKGYNVLPFQFLYISRGEKLPLIYTVNNKWHNAALYGFKTSSGYKYRGSLELLEDIRWHYNNNIFDINREVHEGDGEITLDDSFINL